MVMLVFLLVMVGVAVVRSLVRDRFRFLGGVREVSHERLVAMTRVDHRATEHFLAFAEDSGTIIAAAMVACDP